MYLDAFTGAVTARDWHLFERLVRAAYQSGATREELLRAVETARTMGEVSGPLVAHAYATVHNWQWMMERRPTRADVHSSEFRLEPGIP